MKILVSAYDCAPGRGSEAGIGWNWSTHLAKLGEEVWVITQAGNQAVIDDYLARNPIPNFRPVYVPKLKVPDRLSRSVFGTCYPVYLDWQSRILSVARSLDRDIDFDAVHHVSWGSLQLGSKLWQLGKPFFYGPVGGGQTAPDGFRRYFGPQWRNEKLRSFIVHHMSAIAFGAGRTISNARTVFVTNRETEALVTSMGASKVRFLWDSAVPDGWLRTHEDLPVQGNGPLKLIWVGSLIKRKGMGLALDVMQNLRDRIDATLTVIGDGPDRSWLEAEIRRRDLERTVVYKGRLPWDEVRASYDDHDVMLFTSLRESLGMQLFEAVGRGCAVVCLDMHGAATLVSDDCGIRVPVTDPEATVSAMADAVASLDRDRARLNRLRQGAIAVASNLSWPAKVEVARAAYRDAS
ncbi:glycosyltransferase family 4 protein [Azospirillum canadense]|uniref:glycosyltransferase family 4 protein n=1 Tax=Azospirillum canadense TaxID=403962 RepID=UPI00222690D2|nr:glycosyltransferase family 4 protein [Azospirillum canadense]MCW2238570.1 glycosyltransferase involved in cell wall biosynthesis [Azospirillum canadense]